MYRQPPTELKSAISTMKIILLFALFGLSFGSDGDDGTKCQVNPKADDPNCLAQGLKDFGYFFPAVANYVCAYNKLKEDKNVKNYNVAAQAFLNAMNCTGCHLDKILGKGQTLEDILVKVGQTGSEALKVGIKILQTLGIDETTAKLVCAVAGKLLASDCLRKVLQNIAPAILADLTDLYCKLKSSGATDAAAKTTAILEKLGCLLEQELGLKDGELFYFKQTLLKEIGACKEESKILPYPAVPEH